MLKSLTWLLTIFVVQVGARGVTQAGTQSSTQSAAKSNLPFWKSKPKVYARIQQREVIVSVNSKESPSPPPRYILKASGGGLISAPCDFVYAMAQRYEEMSLLSGYITKSKYHSETQTMDLHIEAFTRSEDLSVKIDNDQEKRTLKFRLLMGSMAGFSWSMAFSDVSAGKCEAGMAGEYKYDTFPIPRLFLEFGLEYVFQRMAQRLRTFVEEERRRGAKIDGPVDKGDDIVKESARK